jgi:hypothetical protein
MLDDRDKIINIMMALNNEGYHQTFTGFILLSTAIGQQEVDGFLFALERALHNLGYVGAEPRASARVSEGESVGAGTVANI